MKKVLSTLSSETEILLNQTKTKVLEKRLLDQKEMIRTNSPYTEDINKYINNYNELVFYNQLKLKEATVTRKALVRDIDWNLFVSHEGKTNAELVRSGLSPYAYDSEDGIIQLHHIGQKVSSPLAELTEKEHKLYGNSKLLHSLEKESWRQSVVDDKAFLKEKASYWNKRVKGQVKYSSTKAFKDLEEFRFVESKDLSTEIIKTIEILLSECEEEDINYINDLANSYALTKQLGAKSIYDFLNKTGHAILCTKCSSDEFVSTGSYMSNGERIQRYRCKKCGTVFTPFKNSIVSGSNLSFIGWLKLIDCLFNNFSVEKTADICRISTKSVLNNRYKLFWALMQIDKKIQLRGNIVVDETFVELSFKGNHGEYSDHKPNRKPHKRGKDSHMPGLSKCKVCIVCAVDDFGNSVARIAGLGTVNAQCIEDAIIDAIDVNNVECIYSDKSAVLKKFADNNNFPIKQCKLIKKGTEKNPVLKREDYITNRYLQIMNSYHSRLKSYLGDFSSPAAKYLSGYLFLFSWKERNKHKTQAEIYSELLAELTNPNQHISSDEILSGRYLPNPLDIIRRQQQQKSFRNIKRVREFCSMYEEGHTMTEIAKRYKVTSQAVSKIIIKAREKGVLQQTKKEKQQQENILTVMPRPRAPVCKRHLEIYEARMKWNGPVELFYKDMEQKYNLSKQTIKNIVCIVKRIIALRQEFSFNEIYEYKELQEIYQKIYSEYVELIKIKNKLESQKILAVKYGYNEANIARIIHIMKCDNSYFSNQRRLSPKETLNRDRALFIDYLRWTGSRNEFYKYVVEKYNISASYAGSIIRFVLIADPKKQEIVD